RTARGRGCWSCSTCHGVRLPCGGRFFFPPSPFLHHGLCKPISAVRYSRRKLVKRLSRALLGEVRIRQYPAEGLACKPFPQLHIFHAFHVTFPSRYRKGGGAGPSSKKAGAAQPRTGRQMAS